MSRVQVSRVVIPRLVKDAYELEILESGTLGSTFDPTITTSISTSVIWLCSNGYSTTTTGTSHALSYVLPDAGLHRWTVRCAAGLDKITVCDCSTDALCGKLADFRKITRVQNLSLYSDPLLTGDLSSLSAMTGMQTLYMYSDPLLTGDLSSLSAMILMQNLSLRSDPLLTGDLSSLSAMTGMKNLYMYSDPLLTGDLSSLSAMTGMQNLSLYSDPLLTGDLSSLSAMTGLQTLSLYSDPLLTGDLSSLSAMTGMKNLYLYSDPLIGSASVASLVAIQDIRIYDLGWLAADVDIVLLSISDAIHADVNHFTYATPSLQIGGTNEAPGGTAAAATTSPLVTPGSGNSDSDWEWDAVAGKHKALTGMAAIYIMRNNTGHVWTVTATGVA